MTFETPKKGHEQFSISDAMKEISALEQMVMGMGANDYEPSAFSKIKKLLERGEISPEAAIREARHIMSGKQDYH